MTTIYPLSDPQQCDLCLRWFPLDEFGGGDDCYHCQALNMERIDDLMAEVDNDPK